METQTTEDRYAQGFNKGYILFQYEQDIAKSFIDNEISVYDDFSEGFKQGLLLAQQEKTLNEFEQLRNQNDSHKQDLER